MITQVFAHKRKMTQAWTKSGKRLAVTCLCVENNAVVGQKMRPDQTNSLEIGFGKKKLKNMTKPLRSKIEKSGFSFGVANIREVPVTAEETLKVGVTIKVEDVLHVGDVVRVQGTTKGRGFAGAIKRHGFSGGPKTHGQSDRWRAVGAIGQRTTPGRVFRGKRMPGHYGLDTQTVEGLVVIHLDPAKQEFWLNGPVPGWMNGIVAVAKTGEKKMIELDEKASGVAVAKAESAAAEPAALATEGDSATEAAPTEGEAQK